MIAYVDSSVLLRITLGEPGRLRQWKEIDVAVTSALTEVECLRTLDRLRLRNALSAADQAARRDLVYRLLGACEVVELSRPVLGRASQPFPTPLGSLDAIHLATALIWRDQESAEAVLATHDAELALAARASGLGIVGV